MAKIDSATRVVVYYDDTRRKPYQFDLCDDDDAVVYSSAWVYSSADDAQVAGEAML